MSIKEIKLFELAFNKFKHYYPTIDRPYPLMIEYALAPDSNPQILYYLLQQGYSVPTAYKASSEVLLNAVKLNRLDVLKMVLNNQELHARDELVFAAVTNGNIEMLEYILHYPHPQFKIRKFGIQICLAALPNLQMLIHIFNSYDTSSLTKHDLNTLCLSLIEKGTFPDIVNYFREKNILPLDALRTSFSSSIFSLSRGSLQLDIFDEAEHSYFKNSCLCFFTDSFKSLESLTWYLDRIAGIKYCCLDNLLTQSHTGKSKLDLRIYDLVFNSAKIIYDPVEMNLKIGSDILSASNIVQICISQNITQFFRFLYKNNYYPLKIRETRCLDIIDIKENSNFKEESLEIIKLVLENLSPRVSTPFGDFYSLMIKLVKRKGSGQVLEYLYQQKQKQEQLENKLDTGNNIYMNALYKIANATCNLQVMQFIIQVAGEQLIKGSLTQCKPLDNIPLLDFLLSKGEVFTSAELERAALTGNVQAIMLFYKHDPIQFEKECTDRVLCLFIENGLFSIAKFLFSIHKPIFASTFIPSLMVCNNLEFVKFILQELKLQVKQEFLDSYIETGNIEMVHYLLPKVIESITISTQTLESLVNNRYWFMLEYLKENGLLSLDSLKQIKLDDKNVPFNNYFKQHFLSTENEKVKKKNPKSKFLNFFSKK
ncbi:hypothetical protein CYY_002028 [Polysphondylium violaceum]|uniref:Ankyrin repeat-containing protein n=1 Tax=Polysphondylium violaceum TaxID=133409 RepID=A0A8J4PYR7_9MYCE|nr:hypothetical protein CYY_002028 [Polysphondylium violaceum]